MQTNTSNNPYTVIASEAKQSINRLEPMAYGSPRPLRGLAMTVFRGMQVTIVETAEFI